MSKKWIGLILICVFLPAIFAGAWYLSVTGEKLTVSNVSSITFVLENEETVTFTSEDDKEFFVELKKSLTPIEKQEFDPNVYSLYQLNYNRVQGDVTYYLCLSADVKNCLAYDVNNNWYRIDKEFAKDLLINYSLDGVYKYSNIPMLLVSSDDSKASLNPKHVDWSYLVADGSYTSVTLDENTVVESDLYISSIDGLELMFEVDPDWYSAKIYDNDIIVYDGLLDDPSYFTMPSDCLLKAVVSAEWYETSNSLYKGNATYEFDFHYDVGATYSINKTELNSGEVIYVHITNADDEKFIASSSFINGEIEVLPFTTGQIVAIPVPMTTKTGEYTIDLYSDRTNFKISVKINAKNFGSVNVGLIRGEENSEYNAALASFKNEISLSDEVVLADCYWTQGWLTPIAKFVNNKEQYWVSAPSYGVEQILNGATIEERNFGVHYVKSVDAQSLPVRAVADGVIAFSSDTTAYGKTVVIEHGQGIKTVYGHLDEVSLNVGDEVKAGEFFAIANPERFSVSSVELFFAVYINKEFVNPFNFINEPRKAEDSDKSDPIEFFIK